MSARTPKLMWPPDFRGRVDSDRSTRISRLVDLAEAAGREILEVYRRDVIGFETKGDGSPLTDADRRAHDVIVRGLHGLSPGVLAVSEEGDVPADAPATFWCVDPLDGTKEFLRRTGEFTVNIALLEDGAPTLGVVHAPATGATWFAERGAGAWRRDASRDPVRIQVALPPTDRPWRVVASRSHLDGETRAFLGRLPSHDVVSAGSSLKICRVAEGNADMYPRFGPTMAWDIAAGHAVLSEAGGRILSVRTRAPLEYRAPTTPNDGFVATGALDPLPFLAEVYP